MITYSTGQMVDANRHLAYFTPRNLQAVFDGDDLIPITGYTVSSEGLIHFKKPPKDRVRFLVRTDSEPYAS